MKKEIYHEMPLSMLKANFEPVFCSGHYALVHLYEQEPEYYQHSVNVLKLGRPFILDNSIFELEEAFNPNRFANWIERLAIDSGNKDFIYIIPDVLDNRTATIESAEAFLDGCKDLPGKPMAVVQGRTFVELSQCYNALALMGLERIGISFNCQAYNDAAGETKLEQWMNGRKAFVRSTLAKRLSEPTKHPPIHLLGCSLPQEMKFYQKERDIVSVDTSNPVVHGLLNIRYTDTGLKDKKSIKLIELFHEDLPNYDTLDNITFNVLKFREFTNG